MAPTAKAFAGSMEKESSARQRSCRSVPGELEEMARAPAHLAWDALVSEGFLSVSSATEGVRTRGQLLGGQLLCRLR